MSKLRNNKTCLSVLDMCARVWDKLLLFDFFSGPIWHYKATHRPVRYKCCSLIYAESKRCWYLNQIKIQLTGFTTVMYSRSREHLMWIKFEAICIFCCCLAGCGRYIFNQYRGKINLPSRKGGAVPEGCLQFH